MNAVTQHGSQSHFVLEIMVHMSYHEGEELNSPTGTETTAYCTENFELVNTNPTNAVD